MIFRARVPIPRASVPTTPRSEVSKNLPEENDDVGFDTELKIQDLPRPQVSNSERANIRQRPKASPLPAPASGPANTLQTNKLPAALVATSLQQSDEEPTFNQSKGVLVNSSPKSKQTAGAVLKSNPNKKPDKVKSGDDYYYYYYYYDDGEDENISE